MAKKTIRIGVLLADKANELQVILPVQVWKKAGYIIELISLEKKNSVILMHGIRISCDQKVNETNLSQYNAIYIPGGEAYKKFFDPKLDEKVIKTLTKDFMNEKKPILAMDEALYILDEWDLIKDRSFTGPSSLKSKYSKLFDDKKKIVISKGLITGTGGINSLDFGLEVVKQYDNTEAVKKIKVEME